MFYVKKTNQRLCEDCLEALQWQGNDVVGQPLSDLMDAELYGLKCAFAAAGPFSPVGTIFQRDNKTAELVPAEQVDASRSLLTPGNSEPDVAAPPQAEATPHMVAAPTVEHAAVAPIVNTAVRPAEKKERNTTQPPPAAVTEEPPAATQPPNEAADSGKPDSWVRVKDQRRGSVTYGEEYFHNTVTGETQWEDPFATVPLDAQENPVRFEGELSVKSKSGLKRWQTRFFSLEHHCLKMFKNSKKSTEKQNWDLTGMSVSVKGKGSSAGRVLVLHKSTKESCETVLMMQAASSAEVVKWVSALEHSLEWVTAHPQLAEADVKLAHATAQKSNDIEEAATPAPSTLSPDTSLAVTETPLTVRQLSAQPTEAEELKNSLESVRAEVRELQQTVDDTRSEMMGAVADFRSEMKALQEMMSSMKMKASK